MVVALASGPADVARYDAARSLSVCRHSVVLHAVRTRRTRDGARVVVAQARRRAYDARVSRSDASDECRSRTRRGARQDPARSAQGRDGGARRGPVRAVLRQRRRDAVVRRARRRLSRVHGRRRDAARDLAQRTRGARLDRKLRRRRPGRVRRVRETRREGAREPRLEGFVRFGVPRRWRARHGLYRALRSTSLCARGPRPRSSDREALRRRRLRRAPRAKSLGDAAPIQAFVLVRGVGHARDRARS